MPYQLPEVIDPEERIEICVPVPNDKNHIRAFLGQLEQLARYWSWDKDATKTLARDAAAVWAEIHLEVAHKIDDMEYCGDESGEDMTAIEDMLRDIKSEMRLLSYDGTPASVNPNAPAVRFDDPTGSSGGTDEYGYRLTALCLAVRRFVYETLKTVIERGALAAGVATPGVVLLLTGGPIGFVIGVIAAMTAAYLLAELVTAAENQEALDEVVCDLYRALRGRPTTAAQFEAAINSLADGTGDRAVIVFVLKQFSDEIQNYQMLLDGLGHGYTAAKAGAENDCCDEEPTCSGYIDFQNDGVPFGWIQGTVYIPGTGLQLTEINGSNRQAWWLHTWETPCVIGQGPNRFRFKRHSAQNNDIWQVWVKRAIDGQWVGNTGASISDGDGWINAIPMNLNLPDGIIGIALQVYCPVAQPSNLTTARGLWWGSDVSGTPPF